jgi:hypothetical protein
MLHSGELSRASAESRGASRASARGAATVFPAARLSGIRRVSERQSTTTPEKLQRGA